MKRLLSKISLVSLITLTLFFYTIGDSQAQNLLEGRVKSQVMESLSSNYRNWQSVTLKGKLKSKGLPISPNIKITMERDSFICISVSALLMGEVGRAVITPDKFTVVNKINKNYISEPLDKFMGYYPGTIADLQEILLGYPVFPGQGPVNAAMADITDLYSNGNEGYLMVPAQSISFEEVDYGYVLDPMVRAVSLLIEPVKIEDTSVTINYEYLNKGYNVILSYKGANRSFSGTLQFDNPVWDKAEFMPVEIKSGYSRITLDKLLKMFH